MNHLQERLLYAYGLGFVSFLQKINVINDMWSRKMFAGLQDFGAVMVQDILKEIRPCLCFYLQYDHEVAIGHPLWNNRKMLHRFKVNASAYVVQLGIFCLHEITIHCKGRMKAKTIKSGIHFYALMVWISGCLFTIWSSGSRNIICIPSAVNNTPMFRIMRGPHAQNRSDCLAGRFVYWDLQDSRLRTESTEETSRALKIFYKMTFKGCTVGRAPGEKLIEQGAKDMRQMMHETELERGKIT